jgi:hypothetical protein
LKSRNWDRSIALAAAEIVFVEVPESAEPQVVEIQIAGGSRRRPALFVAAVGARELIAQP